jgi:hypothetical protein
MTTRFAEVEPADAIGKIERPLVPSFTEEACEDNERVSPARGVILAVLLSAPCWLLIGVAMYMFL